MKNSYPRKINIRFPIFLFLSLQKAPLPMCLVIKKKKKEKKTGIERYTSENENELNRIKK